MWRDGDSLRVALGLLDGADGVAQGDDRDTQTARPCTFSPSKPSELHGLAEDMNTALQNAEMDPATVLVKLPRGDSGAWVVAVDSWSGTAGRLTP